MAVPVSTPTSSPPLPQWPNVPVRPPSGWPHRVYFLGILLFVIVSRFACLGDKPFHHDESLFSFYAWTEASEGNYVHDPLLHGPLQMQIISIIFRVATWLHVMGNGDATARVWSALCGVLLLFLIFCAQRHIRREGVVLALAWVAVSPGLWYYARFVRNESMFLLTSLGLVLCVARAWRSERPTPWIIASFVVAALLVCIKENSLFILFNGFWFLVLLAVFDRFSAPRFKPRSSPPNTLRMLWRSLLREKWAWIVSACLAIMILDCIYTNGWQWPKSFFGMYADIMKYWIGQHREHRLYGEYYYYLPIIGLYEPITVLILLLAVARMLLNRRNLVATALLIAFIVAGLWIGSVGDAYISRHLADFPAKDASRGLFLKKLHMTQPWNLALAFAIGWLTVWGTWLCLKTRRKFRAWLVWWTGLSFLQYSYAGEKVPWIGLHIILPAILLAADLTGSWWRRNRLSFGRQQFAVALLMLAWMINALQGYRLCFLDPTNPGELMVYNHTQMPIMDIGHEMRQRLVASNGTDAPLIEGAAIWPLVWYVHGFNYFTDVTQSGYTSATIAVCDEEYARKHPELRERFHLAPRPFRRAFVPGYSPLHLLTFPTDEQELKMTIDQVKNEEQILKQSDEGDEETDETDDSSQTGHYGFEAWKIFGKYIIDRQPWDPDLTAGPLKIMVGHAQEGKQKSERRVGGNSGR